MHLPNTAPIGLTSNGDFDLNLSVFRFSDGVVFDEDKWFAYLLDKESSLGRHFDLECLVIALG